MNGLRKILISMAAMAFPVAATAVSGDSSIVHRIEVEAVPGRIIHTNEFLKGYNSEVRTMNHSFLAKLKYAFSPPENSEQAQIYKGVYQGVGLAIHDFNPQLGNPVSAYIFQGATIKTLAKRLSLNYEWDFGLTYGWKAHDWDTNPENRVIGSKTTAYIDVDLYLRWILSRNWDLTLYGAWKKKGIDTEAGAYALPKTYGVIGFTLNPLYHVNHWLNLGASLDGSYDGSANIEINAEALKDNTWKGDDKDIQSAPWYRKIALGISARTEFVMPYFTINFGIGHNFVNASTTDMEGFYEILALKIHLLRQAYLHIGYSLYEFYYPNNLMLGIGVHL